MRATDDGIELRQYTCNDSLVRQEAAWYGIEALQKQEQVTTWILDDTGFLKQGSHSVGVQRQYAGSAGKITNCQIAVSLSIIATPTEDVSKIASEPGEAREADAGILGVFRGGRPTHRPVQPQYWTHLEHMPIDVKLYLPKSWAEDRERRIEARIPDEVIFKTKIDLSIDVITEAVEGEQAMRGRSEVKGQAQSAARARQRDAAGLRGSVVRRHAGSGQPQ